MSGPSIRFERLGAVGGGGGGGVILTGARLARSNKDETPSVTSGNGSSTGLTIAVTPAGDGWVGIFVNNSGPYVLGDGIKTKDCYFSSDGGTSAKPIADIAAGDTLYWNGATVGHELDGSDRVHMLYTVVI